jgi:hypothetical protein
MVRAGLDPVGLDPVRRVDFLAERVEMVAGPESISRRAGARR